MSYTEQQLTAAIVSQGLRPVLAGLESGAPSALLSLIQKCWDSDPSNRHSFDEIVKELNSIMVELANVETEECFGVSGLPVGEEHQFNSTCRSEFRDKINWFNEGGLVIRGGSLNLQHWVNSFSNVSTFRPVLSWGSFATCGRREAMEDTHFLLPNLSDENDVHLFGIFDGHRGMQEFVVFDSFCFVCLLFQIIFPMNLQVLLLLSFVFKLYQDFYKLWTLQSGRLLFYLLNISSIVGCENF